MMPAPGPYRRAPTAMAERELALPTFMHGEDQDIRWLYSPYAQNQESDATLSDVPPAARSAQTCAMISHA